MNECTVTFLPSEKSIAASPGASIMELARILNIAPSFRCGGKGTCGRCRVVVKEGREALGPLTEAEQNLLAPEEIKRGMRLSCAIWTPAAAKLVIEIPGEATEDLQIHTAGVSVAVEPNAAVKRYRLELPLPAPGILSSFEKLILAFLEEEHGLSGLTFGAEALRQLSRISDTSGECAALEALVWNGREIIVLAEAGSRGPYGVAVDVGTTTIVCYLLDLSDGRIMAISSRGNAQAEMGEDLMTRISFAMADEGNTARLQSAVIASINQLIADCCAAAGLKPEEIVDCCCAGNTCMQHLFLGLFPRSLGFSPYRPVTTRAITLSAGELAPPLLMNKSGKIYLLPSIAGFVGGDNVSVQLIARRLALQEESKLILDIGTNTEIALISNEGTIICSCPSGPAFEGMHITHGVRGVRGALERIWVTGASGEVKYKTIGNQKPIGICGSGLVDAVAVLLQMGLLQRNGVLKAEAATPRLRMSAQGEREFVLAWKEETDLGKDIVISQRDIVEFQKAKAAIQAACKILLRRKKIGEDQLGKIFMAGAFGQYIDIDNAIATGMLPALPRERIEAIGNAAGSGARMALLSQEARREAERIAAEAEYLELSTDSEFTRDFMKAMFFSLPG